MADIIARNTKLNLFLIVSLLSISYTSTLNPKTKVQI